MPPRRGRVLSKPCQDVENLFGIDNPLPLSSGRPLNPVWVMAPASASSSISPPSSSLAAATVSPPSAVSASTSCPTPTDSRQKFRKASTSSNEARCSLAHTYLAPFPPNSETVEYPFEPSPLSSTESVLRTTPDYSESEAASSTRSETGSSSTKKEEDEEDDEFDDEKRIEPSIKRPLNAFMLYRKAKQREIPTASHRSISRIIGVLWTNETAETKIYYYQLADRQRQQHAIEFPDYKFSPIKKHSNAAVIHQTKKSAQKRRNRRGKRREEKEILEMLICKSEGTNPFECLSDNASSHTGDVNKACPWPFSSKASISSWPTNVCSDYRSERNLNSVVEDIFLCEEPNTKQALAEGPKEVLSRSGLRIELPSPTLPTSNISLMSEREMDEYFASIKDCKSFHSDDFTRF